MDYTCQPVAGPATLRDHMTWVCVSA